MMLEPTIQEINRIFQFNNDEIIKIQRKSGTTDSLVLSLESKQGNRYILKSDYPNQVQLVELLLNSYSNSVLLPKILYTADDKSYFIYTFINGTTHINRGAKKSWLSLFVKELLNKYKKYQDESIWGRIECPRRSWKEFNDIGIEEARSNIGNILTTEDYKFIKSQSHKLFGEDPEHGGRYLLHGDTGVHNFVFNQSKLVGVIDPSPMVGPLIYDFMYAFCSSPDDINIDTLYTAFNCLEHGYIDRSRLIDEVSVQLYCRVGLSAKHHPNDLSEYIKAWEHWKGLCKQLDEGIGII